jgi:hypothetical protein
MNSNLNPFSENDHKTIKAEVVKHYDIPCGVDADYSDVEEARFSAFMTTTETYQGRHRAN